MDVLIDGQTNIQTTKQNKTSNVMLSLCTTLIKTMCTKGYPTVSCILDKNLALTLSQIKTITFVIGSIYL